MKAGKGELQIYQLIGNSKNHMKRQFSKGKIKEANKLMRCSAILIIEEMQKF